MTAFTYCGLQIGPGWLKVFCQVIFFAGMSVPLIFNYLSFSLTYKTFILRQISLAPDFSKGVLQKMLLNGNTGGNYQDPL